MQKSANIKYALYKVTFAAVLCAFFFVQTQAAFIAYAYNDFPQSPVQSHFEQQNHSGSFITKAGAVETHPKFKLNKRYQPVTSLAILPCAQPQVVYYAIVSHEWFSPAPHVTRAFLFCKPLRGPPSA